MSLGLTGLRRNSARIPLNQDVHWSRWLYTAARVMPVYPCLRNIDFTHCGNRTPASLPYCDRTMLLYIKLDIVRLTMYAERVPDRGYHGNRLIFFDGAQLTGPLVPPMAARSRFAQSDRATEKIALHKNYTLPIFRR